MPDSEQVRLYIQVRVGSKPGFCFTDSAKGGLYFVKSAVRTRFG
jgi:hypothetical protein